MPKRIIQLGWLALFVLVTRDSLAQIGPTDKQLAEAVNHGLRFLTSAQRFDGSWSYAGHDVGITALAALALLESGVPASDTRLVGAHRHIRKYASAIGQTYDVSVALLFLDRYGSGDSELIVSLGQRLAAGQLASGGWTYACPPTTPRGTSDNPQIPGRQLRRGATQEAPLRIDLKRDVADNSNTQFAVLGLWAAQRAGLDVHKAMERVDQRFRATQARTGQWNYRPGVKLTSDSMTCAGLISLLLAKGYRTIEQKKPASGESKTSSDSLSMPSDEIIDRALRRVQRIRMNSKSSTHLIWSLGRVAGTLGLSEMGGVSWYERGARVLIRMQSRDGSWRNAKAVPPSSRTADTAFAILFLRRSNLTRDVPRLVTDGGSKRQGKLRH